MVRFKTVNKDNFDHSNIEIIPKNKATIRKRLAEVEAKIVELEALRDSLKSELYPILTESQRV